MEQLLKPQFIIPLLIGIIGIAIFYIWDRRKKKSGSKDEKSGPGEVHYNAIKAIIYDRTTTPYRWYEETLQPDIVKTIVETKNIGRQLSYMGKNVFRFYKMLDTDKKVYYEGVVESSDIKNSPTASYVDVQHPYVSVLDDMTEDKNFMQKYGHLLLWAGIIAFLIVLIVTNK